MSVISVMSDIDVCMVIMDDAVESANTDEPNCTTDNTVMSNQQTDARYLFMGSLYYLMIFKKEAYCTSK